ncbi:hypothetical protein [uncultured Lamprocystis sp.]|nr:hypothetical protein [uncultured Lamprocystis sp.]
MTLEPTERRHDEVPGTRWFRADLHLHAFPVVADVPSKVVSRTGPRRGDL